MVRVCLSAWKFPTIWCAVLKMACRPWRFCLFWVLQWLDLLWMSNCCLTAWPPDGSSALERFSKRWEAQDLVGGKDLLGKTIGFAFSSQNGRLFLLWSIVESNSRFSPENLAAQLDSCPVVANGMFLNLDVFWLRWTRRSLAGSCWIHDFVVGDFCGIPGIFQNPQSTTPPLPFRYHRCAIFREIWGTSYIYIYLYISLSLFTCTWCQG